MKKFAFVALAIAAVAVGAYVYQQRRAEIADQWEEWSGAFEEKFETAEHKASDAAHHLKEKVQHTAESVSEKVQDKAEAVSEKVHDAADKVKEKVTDR